MVEQIRPEGSFDRGFTLFGVAVALMALSLFVTGYVNYRVETESGPMSHWCKGMKGYCGCPNKARCTQDDDRNCGDCCRPNKCLMSNPSAERDE